MLSKKEVEMSSKNYTEDKTGKDIREKIEEAKRETN